MFRVKGLTYFRHAEWFKMDGWLFQETCFSVDDKVLHLLYRCVVFNAMLDMTENINYFNNLTNQPNVHSLHMRKNLVWYIEHTNYTLF